MKRRKIESLDGTVCKQQDFEMIASRDIPLKNSHTFRIFQSQILFFIKEKGFRMFISS